MTMARSFYDKTINPQQKKVQTPSSLWAVCGLSVLVTLSACNTLPPQSKVQTPQYISDIHTSETSLAHVIQPLEEKNPNLTGYHILYDPLEALAARINLIEKSEKTLDLQYYIWDNDKIGSMALHAIIQAADRGVKVRLLMDDNNAKAMEGIYLALDQHVNIDVKLFNPYRFRKFRAMDLVLDLKRMNRRMHNKSFIADHQIALIGGRNMSNQYYNASDNYQFSDLDVMLVGSAVKDINQSFDDYWNHSYAYKVRDIINPQTHPLRYESLKQQLEDHYQDITVQNYLNLANRSHAFDEWLHNNIQFDWVKAEVIKDSPDKIKDKAKVEQHLNFQMVHHLDKPTSSVDLVSAYFVPEKEGSEKLQHLAESGVKVRILTNSYKANDVAIVHAFYAKYRKELLQSGVQLYEFLPAMDDLENDESTKEMSKQTKISLRGLSRSSLHAKMMALDDKQVFIGSFNFDPRSANLNTENGVILNSPSLAHAIHTTMDQQLNRYAYHLVLNAENKIQWIKKTGGTEKIYLTEPRMKWWKQAGLKIVSWLPLEGFM